MKKSNAKKTVNKIKNWNTNSFQIKLNLYNSMRSAKVSNSGCYEEINKIMT